MKLARCLAAVAALALALAAAAGAGSSKPIVVGMAIGKTGFINAYDVPPATAAQIAIDELNAKGGLLGRKIVVVSSDTKSDIAQGGNAAQDGKPRFVARRRPERPPKLEY